MVIINEDILFRRVCTSLKSHRFFIKMDTQKAITAGLSLLNLYSNGSGKYIRLDVLIADSIVIKCIC